MKIVVGNYSAGSDFMLIQKNTGEVIAGGVYDRSQISLKGLTASFQMHNAGYFMSKPYSKVNFKSGGTMTTYITKLSTGYEPIYHSVFISENTKDMIFYKKGESQELQSALYSYLMKKYPFPLLEAWMPWLELKLKENGFLKHNVEIYYDLDHEIETWSGQRVKLSELDALEVTVPEHDLEKIISDGLQKGCLRIGEKRQYPPLLLTDMDTYFERYGPEIVKNLKKEVHPLMPLKGGVEEILLKGDKRLWVQQGAVVNGIANALRKKDSIILNEGMGSGKTLQAISACEAYFAQKAMRVNSELTLKTLYETENGLNYRVIIMAPGHLIEKWRTEVEENIPYAKATILRNFSDVIAIKQKGYERQGREFYILGKDFGKLSCSEYPTPSRYVRKYPVRYACPTPGCNHSYTFGQLKGLKDGKCVCGMHKRFFKRVSDRAYGRIKGLACPECNGVMIRKDGAGMCSADFAEKNSLNLKCPNCGSKLWAPCVNTMGAEKEIKWHKISHFTNAKKKERKTAWVLNGDEYSYLRDLKEYQKLSVEDISLIRTRKWAPAIFIQRELKGFFDVAIFDEMHVYKGGDTAQGNAMHALCVASKKRLGLTGTIAGGMANHLFYTLWRLAPQDMRKLGYRYEDEDKFIHIYGTEEKEFEGVTRSIRSNSMSKGRQVSSPKVKPGISPLIFQDFLVDKTVFLDLSDMSSHLPKLEEKVVQCRMSNELNQAYEFVVKKINDNADLKRVLASSLLQFSLAYPDKPYDTPPIIDPRSGEVVVQPPMLDKTKLFPKEKLLIETVNNELDEGRNIFIYAEYTGDEGWRVTDRLAQLVRDYCGLEENEVQVIEAGTPAASKREEYIHKKAAKGAKVFICNPRLVETGLDFIFTYNDKKYNYPTLIFYQMGMNLFTLWQASRRAFRLNQTEMCRNYYFCYEGTNQAKMVRLMAEKQVATAAIQGHFSMEGLAAMSAAVDPRIVLMNNLSSHHDDDDAEEASRMFKTINAATGLDESVYGETRTLLFKEVFPDESGQNQAAAVSEELNNLMDMFDDPNGMSDEKVSVTVEAGVVEQKEQDDFDELLCFFGSGLDAAVTAPAKRETRKPRKKVDENSFSFFDLEF